MGKADILICGGSLAGAATAIRLKQLGFTPIVIEKKKFPRKKLCGEFLGPDSFASLQQLGVLEKVFSVGYGPIEFCDFYPFRGKPQTVKMVWLNSQFPFGLGISREHLDEILLDEVKAHGITVCEQYRIHPHILRDGADFRVNVESLLPGGIKELPEIQTPIIVDATGKSGGLWLNKRPMEIKHAGSKVRIGIKVNVQLPEEVITKNLRMFFFPGGYGGIQPLSNQAYNLCMLISAESATWLSHPFSKLIANTIGKHPVAMALLDKAEPLEKIETTTLSDFNLKPVRAYDLIQVGDALITVDPFTGSGMALALETGVLAAECLAQGLRQGKSYFEICRQYHFEYRRRFGQRLALIKAFRPYLFSESLQNLTLPLLSPVLPVLTRLFR